VTSRASGLRVVALLGAGTLAVHELRYALAFGRHAERAAADQGHAYLSVAVPVFALVIALATVQLLFRLAARRRVEMAASPAGRVWAAASLALIAAYSVQEWVEGAVASGHPAGTAGVVGHGGWIAFAAAVAVGALIALALRGAAAASRPSTPVDWLPPAQAPPASRVPAPWRRSLLDVVALHLGGRGPPLTSV
jgi:hypothetical protein